MLLRLRVTRFPTTRYTLHHQSMSFLPKPDSKTYSFRQGTYLGSKKFPLSPSLELLRMETRRNGIMSVLRQVLKGHRGLFGTHVGRYSTGLGLLLGPVLWDDTPHPTTIRVPSRPDWIFFPDRLSLHRKSILETCLLFFHLDLLKKQGNPFSNITFWILHV